MRTSIVLSFVLLCASALPAEGSEIHKCRGASGQVSWSDKPCPDDAKTEATRNAGGASFLVGLEAHCGKTDLDWNQADSYKSFDRSALPQVQQDALIQASAGLAYSRPEEFRWRRGRGGEIHLCSVGANREPSEVVIGVDGKVVLFSRGRSRYLNDPDTPTARLEACSSSTTACFAPTDKRSIDQCVAELPRCGSLSTRACCPQECKDAYRRARATGTDPMGALQHVLYGPSSCVPGMNQALGRATAN